VSISGVRLPSIRPPSTLCYGPRPTREHPGPVVLFAEAASPRLSGITRSRSRHRPRLRPPRRGSADIRPGRYPSSWRRAHGPRENDEAELNLTRALASTRTQPPQSDNIADYRHKPRRSARRTSQDTTGADLSSSSTPAPSRCATRPKGRTAAISPRRWDRSACVFAPKQITRQPSGARSRRPSPSRAPLGHHGHPRSSRFSATSPRQARPLVDVPAPRTRVRSRLSTHRAATRPWCSPRARSG